MAIRDHSAIEPTLFIGLGGAGGNVLGRLRTMFEQECGVTGGKESPVQFLLLDADDFGKLDETVRDSLNEQEDFLPLSHFNPRHYIDEHWRDHRSDLHRWFDPKTRPLLADEFIRDGASRLRMLGRLCLHRSYTEVEKIIGNKMSAARSARAYAQGTGPIRNSERPFRVIILGGSCGGTGSGIFLDIVHMVNRLVRGGGTTPDVLGFVFLPFWFIDKNRNVDTDLVRYYQANAWAFFEELNYVLLQPSRLTTLALDPERPHGVELTGVPRDIEPLKTVYLLGAGNPKIGSFNDSDDWYTYLSRAMLQVFLAPEEGSLESVFSNVRTKQGEVDRRYGLRKRFAALGYADVRDAGRVSRRHPSHRAAREFVRNLLAPTSEESEAAVEREAERLLEMIEGIINAQLKKLEALKPTLKAETYQKTQGSRVVANIPMLAKVGDHVSGQIDMFNRAIPSPREVDAATGEVKQIIEGRLERLTLGLKREQDVLARVFERLRQKAEDAASQDESAADETGLSPSSNGFFLDVPLMESVQAVQAKATRGKGVFGGSSEPLEAYNPLIDQINHEIKENLTTFLEQEKRIRRRYLVERIGGREQSGHWLGRLPEGGMALSVLGAARVRLERAIAALTKEAEQTMEVELKSLDKRTTITSRYFPDAHDREARFQTKKKQYDDLTHRVQKTDAEWWEWMECLRPLLAPEVSDSAAVARTVLAALEKRFEDPAVESKLRLIDSILEARKAGNDRARHLISNLIGLSSPCCNIDRNKLAPGDRTPTMLVVSTDCGEEEIREWLNLDTPPAVIRNEGDEVGVAQAVFAFSSYVVAGMLELRPVYETRDRTRSFPHITQEWNENDLHVSRNSELTDAELCQFAKARAISDLLNGLLQVVETGSAESAKSKGNGDNGKGTGVGSKLPFTGLRLYAEGSALEEVPWILKYEKESRDNRMHLRARSVDPVPGRKGSWRVEREWEDLRELNLDQNVRHYIASASYESHCQLLREIDELERGTSTAAVYLNAYHAYWTKLEALADDYRDKGMLAEELLHRRMAAALRRYADGLRAEDGKTP